MQAIGRTKDAIRRQLRRPYALVRPMKLLTAVRIYAITALLIAAAALIFVMWNL
jgi:hypothetical protein